MPGAAVPVGIGEICPHLGLPEDPAVRCLSPSLSHRCHCGPRPEPVTTTQQNSFCLAGSHRACHRWQPDSDFSITGEAMPAFEWDWEGIRDMGAQFFRHLSTSLIALAWVAVAVGAVFLLAPMLGAAGPATGAGGFAPRAPLPTNTAPQVAVVNASPVVQLSATETSATPNPDAEKRREPVPVTASLLGAASTTVQAPSPTAVPAAKKAESTPSPAEKTYVVQKKDTLWSVARANGVTVEELMKANGLTDRNRVLAGQTLVIPNP